MVSWAATDHEGNGDHRTKMPLHGAQAPPPLAGFAVASMTGSVGGEVSQPIWVHSSDVLRDIFHDDQFCWAMIEVAMSQAQ